MIGQTLGHYRIDERIGAGGMGEVYRATDTRLDRTVAIKVLLAHVADDPERLARLVLLACTSQSRRPKGVNEASPRFSPIRSGFHYGGTAPQASAGTKVLNPCLLSSDR